MILSYKSYFILQELYQVELHPHPLHSLAKGTQTLVNPIGYPHFLAPQSTSTTTPREPTIHVCTYLESWTASNDSLLRNKYLFVI